MLAGYGEKMIFNSDTWKAYKYLLEADPRFYQHYCTPAKFVDFFRQESPQGVNLVREQGKKYANLNASNVLAALEEAKAVTETDHFSMAEAHNNLKAAKENAIKRLDKWTSFAPNERIAIEVSRQKGFAVRPRPPATGAYLLMTFDHRRHAIQQFAFDVNCTHPIQLIRNIFPQSKTFLRA